MKTERKELIRDLNTEFKNFSKIENKINRHKSLEGRVFNVKKMKVEHEIKKLERELFKIIGNIDNILQKLKSMIE